MKKALIKCIVLFAFLMVALPLQAHMLWLNADNYNPEVGEEVYLQIAFGHEYPVHQYIKPDRIRRIHVLDPDGKKIKPEKIFTSIYKFTPRKKGAYIAVVEYRHGFMTITEDGKHLLKSKQGVDNVKNSFQYIINAKALVVAGDSDKGLSQKAGEPLEIVPLQNPASLEKGAGLEAKVFFKDKALTGAMVQPVNTFYNEEKKPRWGASEISGKEGKVSVELDACGQWTLKSEHSVPYPDQEKADEYMYATTLTFGFECK